MGQEIERKFLVRNNSWHSPGLERCHIRQGYLTEPNNPHSIRIRIVDNRTGVITIKSAVNGICRNEFEYAIPSPDAQELIASALGCVVEKTRFIWTEGDARWEIDRSKETTAA